MKNKLIVILGATASGKTKLATHLAIKLDAEIISADSRQVYKNLNIGTGKDINEYNIDNRAIPYHLIDIIEPTEKYHIYQFQQDFKNALKTIENKAQSAILCGGSGMYIEAVLKQFEYTQIPINEELRVRLSNLSLTELQNQFQLLPTSNFNIVADISNIKKTIRAIEINTFLANNESFENTTNNINAMVFGIKISQKDRWINIENRLIERLNNGLIEEVESLLGNGLTHEKLHYFGLEYKYVSEYILGNIKSKDELREKLNFAIRQFSKRQETYFRKIEKTGIWINWIPFEWGLEEKIEFILESLKK